jgi:preprotein translocase subunit YajC
MNGKIPAMMELISSLMPIVLVFAILYFFMIRPQQQKHKKHSEMLSNVKNGDRVLMASGIFGVIKTITTEREIELEISRGVVINCLKASISDLTTTEVPKIQKQI